MTGHHKRSAHPRFAHAFPGWVRTKNKNKHNMQRKQNPLVSLLQLVTCAVLALGATAQIQAADKKADAAGTWTWSTPGRNGGPDRKSTLKLKVDGDKVTGSIS